MNNELISLIVPVYNTSKYLRKCLNSIIGQTYENLEIIIVNDGSTDDSLAICREYQETDKRVRLINRENGGQSAARNDGIAAAKASLIGFIDSDDYIDKDFVECLYRNLRKNGTDISICGIRSVDETGERTADEIKETVTVYDNKRAMELLLEDREYGSHPCNKLFDKRLFSGVTFPVGRVYEDIAVMHVVFGKAERVVVSTAVKYNYLIHGSSTTHSGSPAWGYSLFLALYDRCRYVFDHYPDLYMYSLEKAYGIAIGMYIHLIRFKTTPKIEEYRKEIRAFISDHISSQKQFSSISRPRKRDAGLIVRFPAFERVKYKVYFAVFRKKDCN